MIINNFIKETMNILFLALRNNKINYVYVAVKKEKDFISFIVAPTNHFEYNAIIEYDDIHGIDSSNIIIARLISKIKTYSK